MEEFAAEVAAPKFIPAWTRLGVQGLGNVCPCLSKKTWEGGFRLESLGFRALAFRGWGARFRFWVTLNLDPKP